MSPPRPYDYQAGIDSGETFAIFSAYLLLPHPRKLSHLYGTFGVSPQTLRHWAKEGLWEDRALALDREQHSERMRIAAKANTESAAELQQKQLDRIELGKALVERETKKLLLRSIELESSQMKPNDITRLYAELFKAERLVRGQATEITNDESDLSKLTDEELALFGELLKKAKRDT